MYALLPTIPLMISTVSSNRQDHCRGMYNKTVYNFTSSLKGLIRNKKKKKKKKKCSY
jgi:hypothetical protein